MITLLVGYSQIMMNNKHVVADWSRGLLLCSVAEADFGSDMCVRFTHADSVATLTVCGLEMTGDSIVIPHVDADTRLPVTAMLTDSTMLEAQLQFTFLPIVAFSGIFNKTTYEIAPFAVMLPDADDLLGRAKVRYRGSLINQNAVVKRGYHIKFVDDNDEKLDVKLFGLRNDNSWILEGGAADLLRIRNRVATDLWLDMAAKPYYVADEPNARLGARGQLVEMFVNGEYIGVYNMGEALDRKQMKLMKYDAETLDINGQLWKVDDRSPITLMDSVPPTMPSGRYGKYNLFETKYPDIEEVLPTNYDLLYNLGKLCCEADDSTFAAQIGDLLDVPVVIDHYIFLETLLAFDNQGKNLYWGCYNRNTSPKLTMGVWDLDTSFGHDWKVTLAPHSLRVQPWHSIYKDFGNHHRFLRRLKELDVDSFNTRVLERYRELREGPLDTQALIDRFTTAVDMLNRSGTAQREKWRFDPDPWMKITIDINAELAYVTKWIEQHMDYLDNCVFTTEVYPLGDVTHDGVVDILDINELVNMMLRLHPERGQGDVNHDQVIDVEDMNIVINVILNRIDTDDDSE